MLNGKFKCVSINVNRFFRIMTNGETYEFNDGRVRLDDGRHSMVYDSLEDWNERNSIYKLIPIELPQPSKSLLKSGDKVVYRNGNERYVLLEVNCVYDKQGMCQLNLSKLDDNLKISGSNHDYEVVEIYRGDELIAKRVEKSEKDIEIEAIEDEMRKLADRLRKVKGK